MNTNNLCASLHPALLILLVIFSSASCSASKSQSEPTAESDYAEMKNQAAKEFPNEQKSVALANSSQKVIVEEFAVETDQEKREIKAAGMFMGFYNLNTRARLELCNEYNIDIQPFIAAFKERHTKEYEKAMSIRKSTVSFEDREYNAIRPQLRAMVEQDMKDIASTSKTTIAGACELVAANADYLSSIMHISKIQPLIYKELINAK